MLISFMRSYGSINLNMMAISNPAFDANRRFPPEVFLPGVCAADGSLLRGEQTRQTHHLLEFLTGERVPALFPLIIGLVRYPGLFNRGLEGIASRNVLINVANAVELLQFG